MAKFTKYISFGTFLRSQNFFFYKGLALKVKNGAWLHNQPLERETKGGDVQMSF